MKKLFVTAALVITSQFAFGSILTTDVGTAKIESVTLATKGTTADGSVLTMVGAGLRTKKVVGITAKVYVAQVFVSSPENFVHSEDAALSSAATSKSVAIQLTFLRSVDAATVQSSFVEALQVNKVDLNAADVKAFLAAVANGGDAQNKKTMTILVQKSTASGDNSEALQYEDTAGKTTTVQGTAGLGQKVLSIWLGESADDQLAACKKQIIGQ